MNQWFIENEEELIKKHGDVPFWDDIKYYWENEKMPKVKRKRDKILWILGWTIAGIGTVGLFLSGAMEIIVHEPIYLLTAKISSGVTGIGGMVVGLISWKVIKPKRR